MPLSLSAVLSNLCWYDPRRPAYDPDVSYGPPGISCSCDNCFYNRHRLAEEVLRLRAELGLPVE